MPEREKCFEQAELRLYSLKEKMNFSDLQFERIKSTIFKSSIWDRGIDEAIVDFMNEFDEDEKEEMKFRYETAKIASTSAKELWNQLNKCSDIELPKESIIIILSYFIEYFKEFADQFNDNKDTEVLIHLRKSLEDIKQM
ncbi:hypothetical protein [Aminipila sp.]|uniref:hypothetical protein n=1 Tax=Aminipila sp. TaxID=2060095 RepID=UPI0028977BB9|nr:hypothetical protein [Aminipila sp.]